MKKVIFISAIALAAAVSCTKSEVVDTKFNEQIGFETYLGRDAQTKGTVETAKTIGSAGVYGYYLGKDGSEWSTTSEANLWNPLTLVVNAEGVAQDPAGNDVRYWANDSDEYMFLAYAPMEEVTVNAGANGVNPAISYTVDTDIENHVDVLKATPVYGSKTDISGAVALNFKHALSRITVKANVDKAEPFEFHVKSVTLSGKFNTEGTLALAAQGDNELAWTVSKTEDKVFSIYTNPGVPGAENTTAVALPTTGVNYAGEKEDNYMMIIPTEFSKETPAVLKVVYTTYYAGLESREYEVVYNFESSFDAGFAYAFNLAFTQATDNAINFSVTVDKWTELTDVEVIK